MSMLISIGIILIAGALGGIINALVSDNGFIKPREEIAENVSIIRPGFAGNILVGAIAAFISWGLYDSSYSSAIIYGSVGLVTTEMSISISAVAGAILVGIGGARWLTDKVDKSLLRSAAATAAASRTSYTDSQKIAYASPSEAFNIARKMYQE